MTFNYIAEAPSTDEFHTLLKFAAEFCDGMMLVIPDEALSEEAEAVLKQLAPYAAGKARASAWPGHTMKRGAASLCYFDYNEEVCNILIKNSTSLYDWAPPALPEGLFLTRKQAAFLVTHIRQNTAYISAKDERLQALKEAIPTLKFTVES